MYTPDRFKIKEDDEIFQFIQRYNFGALISSDLEATHLPFIAEHTTSTADKISNMRLFTHFARANPHWKTLDKQEILVIFSGPHAYISPTWYSSTPEVPTWNFSSPSSKKAATS